jgi:hypothetical protein
MPTIRFEAKAHAGSASAHGTTAQDAVRLFLQKYRIQKFSVSELRDGQFKTHMMALLDPTKRGPDDCFYRSFTARAEAQAFLAQA